MEVENRGRLFLLTRDVVDKAASLVLAERYIDSFGNLAKTTNTMIVPAGVSEPVSMLAQALSIYGKITEKKD